uniref:Uncharacterized protein n=1 Tax=Avena sativa TaxID=4498 RepID=A0ACD5YBQ6_AVESA
MTEKVSATLIIESNLDCEKCYRKIQKVLCKLQEKEKIRTINFDTKKNTVTVSGPFDPVMLSRKLRCKAREAIKDIKIVEEKKPEPPKKEEKKPEPKKEEKKPEEKKKPADDCCKCCKKPDEKKSEEKKKPEEKKPEEKKKPEEPKPKDDPKPAPAPAPSTTVNLQFTQMCNLCYPWPCSDPSHWGGVHQYPQPQAPPQQPQWPCEPPPTAMPAFPGHHHQPYPPWAPATPKRQPCGGPSYCGGCGSCGGGYNGWPPAMPTPLQMMQPPPMMGCGGPASSCRGCKGCRIVQEGRFIYEEYPPSACTVM